MDTVKIYSGLLFLHGEMGYEGSPYAFQDADYISNDGQDWSYSGLHILENGDILEVSDSDGKHIWTGLVNIKYDPYTRPTWKVQNMDQKEWRNMFCQYPNEYKARLIKRNDWITQEIKKDV